MTEFASACVLSYCRMPFLRDCVSTLRERALAPFELIVHDDGSPDTGMLSEWVGSGVVSTAILNPPGHNQGQGVALNRMFEMAKGDPIIKLDQDLLFEPAWLAQVLMLMHCHPSIGLLGLMHYHADPVDSAKTLLEQHELWSSRTHILGSAFAVRRACWEELGPFEEHSEAFAEDWMFQKAVTASERWCCALPDTDLVRNIGMGIGPSTVVVAEGTVAHIHREPVIHGAE